MRKIVLMTIMMFVIISAQAQSYPQTEVRLTREIPDIRHSWIFNKVDMKDGDEIVGDRLFSIGQGRFFSIWVKAEATSGNPDFSLYVLGSFDDNIDNLGRDLAGTYEIVEECKIANEWLFHYVSPSPCSSITAKAVANSGSSDFKISVVLFKTGS